jgi:hypothetical protein
MTNHEGQPPQDQLDEETKDDEHEELDETEFFEEGETQGNPE